MYHSFRIGSNIQPNDPFWVQVREAVQQRMQLLGATLVPVDTDMSTAEGETLEAALEELLSQDLDALIGWDLPDDLIHRLLDYGLPIVHLHDRAIQHPLFVSPRDLTDAAYMLGEFVASELGGQGNVIVVGGMSSHGEDGRCRIIGFHAAIDQHPGLRSQHVPCLWRYDQAYPQIQRALAQIEAPIDAIFGLSDSLALAGRNVARELGLLHEGTLIVGINGDPLALAAIVEGSMAATVDTCVVDYGYEIAEVACRIARRELLPKHFTRDQRRLVTASNVAEVAAQKLTVLAEIPNHLVGVNHRQERQRLIQLETNLAINRQVGLILDREELSNTLANLIRTNYGYDHVRLLLWSEAEGALFESAGGPTLHSTLAPDESGVLKQVIARQELLFIPDTRRSHRFAPDTRWPATRTRVALPMRLGATVVGVLDLHNFHPTHHDQAELIGLQMLADQMGIAMRNADLYSEALASRAIAEKADRLKTQLLANVSHELRTPLNVILGYSQAALSSPSTAQYALPPGLHRDMQYIYNSGEHLMRLINDLLDLSRAEIDELDLFPEVVSTGAFLREVFDGFVEGVAGGSPLRWQLELPAHLPLIQADPVRLRQVLHNLLSNAAKFTQSGAVTLGAELAPPFLHVWVRDTGIGIPADQHERIFEPFVSDALPGRRPEGIGLGLCIARRLALLHRGTLAVESQPGGGSTFHLHLPLPGLGEQASVKAEQRIATLLLLASQEQPTPAIAEICQRQGLVVRRILPSDTAATLLAEGSPAAIAWDLDAATPEDWALLERLRSNALLCQLPFMLLAGEGGSLPGGLTNILPKPASAKTLLETLAALRPSAGTGSVLIVDDDAHARELYRRLVAEALPSYAARSAADGHAALREIAETPPSLVILDLSMPDMDGFALLAQLRQQPATQHIPVLVVSSRVLSLDDIRQLEYSRVTFHSKNILVDNESIELLRRAISGAEALPPQTSTLVRRAVAYLQTHHAEPLSRQQIAAAIGVSKNYLSEIFHQELGISPWDYLNRYRVQRAKSLLRTTNRSITSIAVQVGFGDSSYFGRVFHRHVGRSPSEFRE